MSEELELGKAGFENAVLAVSQLLHAEEHLIERVWETSARLNKTTSDEEKKEIEKELNNYIERAKLVRNARQKLVNTFVKSQNPEEVWCIAKHLALAYEYMIEAQNKGIKIPYDVALVVKHLMLEFFNKL